MSTVEQAYPTKSEEYFAKLQDFKDGKMSKQEWQEYNQNILTELIKEMSL